MRIMPETELIHVLREIRGLGLPDADFALAALPDPNLLPGLLDDPRFQELVEIVNLAIQVHGEKTREWFLRPEPELGFVLPATLLRDPANGRSLVKQSLINHLRGPYAVGRDGKVLPKGESVVTPAGALPHGSRKRLGKPRKKRRA
jgi:hypothetical protein